MKHVFKLIVIFLLLNISSPVFANEEVNIYSYRQSHLIQPLLDEFTAKTGIKTNAVYIKQGIAEKLEFEGKKSPADLVLTVDIYRLSELKSKYLTAPLESVKLKKLIPLYLRDKDNHWFALSMRARVIYTSNDENRAPIGEVTSYLDLANPKLGKRVCIRPLSHIYNLGLTSSLVAQYGEKRTEQWMSGLKNNLARRPQGNDRAQIKAITQNVCDYAIANSYYFSLLELDDSKWTRNIRIITPSAKNGGTHSNISGMAMTRHAPNKVNARKLMEFLVDKWAQFHYAQTNQEFPVVEGIEISNSLKKNFGDFDRQNIDINTITNFIHTAQRIVNKVGIDQ